MVFDTPYLRLEPNNGFNKRTMVSINKSSLVLYSLFAAFSAITFGMLIGYYGFVNENADNIKTEEGTIGNIEEIKSAIKTQIKTSNIRNNLKKLTEKPHVAGSHQDEKVLVDFVKSSMEEANLDHVEVVPYEVLLSYPNMSNPNYLALVSNTGQVLKKSKSKEPPLTQNEKDPAVIDGFNSYSPAGHVVAKLIYVNFAKVEDFEYLLKSNINVSGLICIARYGSIFRGDKATNAQQFGCVGLVIFSDPLDYGGYSKHSWTPEDPDHSYPNTWWLPKTGFQRGSLHMGGDPETMFYPSLNITYRDDPTQLPQIPVQPISFADAYEFLSILGGLQAPDKWQGGFGFTYKIGGSFQGGPFENSSLELHVGNYAERKTIHNVLGYIYGSVEPDRYVLYGNHRDAWEFGGADPSSGTAVLLEAARAIGHTRKSAQWQPRRTIVFCNWGAEEHGLIGSTEWVEEFEKRLIQRAVAYINVDIAVQGNATFRASATPTLYQLLFNTTQKISNPNAAEVAAGRPSVFDTWLHVQPDEDFQPTRPFIRNLGSGSDYTMFVQRAGVASIDMRYTFSERLSSYPVYHSLHDTFEYFETFLDPQFKYSLAVAEISTDLIVALAASKVLPIQPLDYPGKLEQMSKLLQRQHGQVLEKAGISLDNLNYCIQRLKGAADVFNSKRLAAGVSDDDEMKLRQLNDQLFYIDRGFLDFTGIPGRAKFRHVIFAPALHDSYSGSGFPGVTDAIFEAVRGGTYERVKKQLSVLCVHILAAANLME